MIIKNVSDGQAVYGKALDAMVELLRNTKDEQMLIALLFWFKTISELEDQREVNQKTKRVLLLYQLLFYDILKNHINLL